MTWVRACLFDGFYGNSQTRDKSMSTSPKIPRYSIWTETHQDMAPFSLDFLLPWQMDAINHQVELCHHEVSFSCICCSTASSLTQIPDRIQYTLQELHNKPLTHSNVNATEYVGFFHWEYSAHHKDCAILLLFPHLHLLKMSSTSEFWWIFFLLSPYPSSHSPMGESVNYF